MASSGLVTLYREQMAEPPQCGARSSVVRDDPKARPIRPCVQVARAAPRTAHARGQAGDREAGPQAGQQFGRRHDRVMVARFAPAPHIDALVDEVGEDGWSGFRSAAHGTSIEQNRNINKKIHSNIDNNTNQEKIKQNKRQNKRTNGRASTNQEKTQQTQEQQNTD